MFKKVVLFIFCLIIFISVTNIFTYAAEPDDMSADLSEVMFFVDGSRVNFRAYDFNGDVLLNLFEVANVFSGTNKQFAVKWTDRNRSLSVAIGVPQNVIGPVSARTGIQAGSVRPVDTKLLIDGKEIKASGYRIAGTVYFDLYDIARGLDFHIERNPTEKTVQINTDKTFAESTVIRIIDPTKPMIALTFDDGPSHVTESILDTLDKYGAVATFYVVGNRITRNVKNREIVLRAFEAGNEIANHSHTHKFFTRISDETIRSEIISANNAIESITGTPPKHMRPPYADMDRRVRNVIAGTGLPIILWSVDPSDWLTRNADKTFDHVMENVKDKDIILLHDMWEPSGEAAIRLIPALTEKGFQLVTVSELMYHSNITMQPGVVYNNGN